MPTKLSFLYQLTLSSFLISPNMKTHHTVDEEVSQIDLLREFIENILGLRKADLNFKDVDQKDVEKNVSQTLLSLIRLDAER